MYVYASLQLFTPVSYIFHKSDIFCCYGNHFGIKIHLLLGYQDSDSRRKRKGQNIRVIHITRHVLSHSFKYRMIWSYHCLKVNNYAVSKHIPTKVENTKFLELPPYCILFLIVFLSSDCLFLLVSISVIGDYSYGLPPIPCY